MDSAGIIVRGASVDGGPQAARIRGGALLRPEDRHRAGAPALRNGARAANLLGNTPDRQISEVS